MLQHFTRIFKTSHSVVTISETLHETEHTYFWCMQIVIHHRLRTHLQKSGSVPRCQSDSIHVNEQTITYILGLKRYLRLLLLLNVTELALARERWDSRYEINLGNIFFGTDIKFIEEHDKRPLWTFCLDNLDFIVNTIVKIISLQMLLTSSEFSAL